MTAPWDILNPNTEYVSEEVFSERYSICEGCEHFISSIKVCGICKCFMKFKCSFKESHCPVNKWGKDKEINGNNI